MKFDLFFSIVLGILLSMVVSKVVYYGFTPNYAADIFSKKTFNERFDHDVYKYRILSKYLLFKVDEQLGKDGMPAWLGDQRLEVNTKYASLRFYMAFYDLNAAFLILTSIMTALLLYLPGSFNFSTAEKNLILFFVPVIIGLSEFTVCCYDVSSYFFQLLILYIFLRWSSTRFWITITVIAILIILSTLNRESSALSVSMMTILLCTRFGVNRRSITAFALITVAYLLTYIALRVFIKDPSHMRIINLQAGQLLIDTNFIGLLFWGLFFYLPWSMSDRLENRYLILGFYVLSLPYIYTCLVAGVLWEIRLFVPLFLGALFLSKLDTASQVVQLSTLRLRLLRRELK